MYHLLLLHPLHHPDHISLLQHEVLGAADEEQGLQAVRHAENVNLMVLVKVVTISAYCLELIIYIWFFKHQAFIIRWWVFY